MEESWGVIATVVVHQVALATKGSLQLYRFRHL